MHIPSTKKKDRPDLLGKGKCREYKSNSTGHVNHRESGNGSGTRTAIEAPIFDVEATLAEQQCYFHLNNKTAFYFNVLSYPLKKAWKLVYG